MPDKGSFDNGLDYKVADISSFPVSLGAQRYAGALFDSAIQAACLGGVEEIVNSLAVLLEESADFRRFIASPLYNAETQMRVISALARQLLSGGAKKSAGGVASRFLGVLAQHKRLYLLPEIISAFTALTAKSRGDIAVSVVSAEQISEAQQGELRVLLAETAKKNEKFGKYLAGKNLILHKRVDPALLGGFIVRCGSLLIDASLRTKLSSLKFALKEVG